MKICIDRFYIVDGDGRQYLGMKNGEPVFCDDGSVYLNERQVRADRDRIANLLQDDAIRVERKAGDAR